MVIPLRSANRSGIGPSGPQVAEGWHGVPYGKPLQRTREYIEIVRMILAREKPVELHGKDGKLKTIQKSVLIIFQFIYLMRQRCAKDSIRRRCHAYQAKGAHVF